MTELATTTSIEERLARAGLPPIARLSWIEIDEDALASNFHIVRRLLPSETQLAAVVKSDGYGHGIQVAARTFAFAGADLLSVATLEEALLVRVANVTAPILLLFTIQARDVVDAGRAGFELVATEKESLRETLEAWNARGDPAGSLRMHLEIETGLGRAGFAPRHALDAAHLIARTPGVTLASIWSHLASADDARVSREQVSRLEAVSRELEATGLGRVPRHLAATGGVFAATAPPYDVVRMGLGLYGELPRGLQLVDGTREAAARLRPVMTLKARPLRVESVERGTPVGYGGTWRADRRSLIATLPIGYGDGWSRAYGNRAYALVRGRRVPMVGTVAMDAVAADVTDVGDITLGDEFVLLGEQGGQRLAAADLAQVRNTISWEVLSSMSARLPRVYHAAAGLSGLRTLLGETLAEVKP